MATWALAACVLCIAASLAVAAHRGVRGRREGRFGLFLGRVRSPTVYLFAAYLLIAAMVTPRSAGETTSPLLWLALVLPIAWAAASLASIGSARVTLGGAVGLALLYAGMVMAAGGIVLAAASPDFVPAWLR